jgi:hypothetical protein
LHAKRAVGALFICAATAVIRARDENEIAHNSVAEMTRSLTNF